MHPSTTIDNQSHLKFPPTLCLFSCPRSHATPTLAPTWILATLYIAPSRSFSGRRKLICQFSFVVSEVSVPICAVTEFNFCREDDVHDWGELLNCSHVACHFCLLWWCVRFLWRFALRTVSLVGNLISCTVLVSMKVEFGVSAALSIGWLSRMLEGSEWYSANFGRLLIIILPLMSTLLLAPSLHCYITLRRYAPPIFGALSEAAVMLWLVVGPVAFAFLPCQERASVMEGQ